MSAISAADHHPSNPPRRTDLAHKHATKSQLRSIYFVESLNRWELPRELSARARRCLRFFCALHRAGGYGYVGTRAPLAAVADAIRDANDGEACSVKTLERGRKELVAKGYLVESYGFEGVREIEPNVWIRDRVVLLTTTRKARDLWSRTSDHKATKSRTNESPNPPDFKNQGSSARAHALEDDPTRRFSNEVSLRDDVAPRDHAEAVDELPTEPVVAVEEPRPSPRPIAPRDKRADGDRHEVASQEPCQPPRPRRPERPVSLPPRARRVVVEAILRCLEAVTRDRADEHLSRFIRARAAHEIATGRWDSGIDWDFWVACWSGMRQPAKRWWARRELVPLLSRTSSSPAASTVSPSRTSSSPAASTVSPSRPSSENLEGEIDPSNPFSAHLSRILGRLEK